MTRVFAETAVGLAAAVVILLLFTFAVHVRLSARRRFESELRPRFELAVARYLAVEDAPVPPVPAGRAACSLFVEVCRDAIAELRGGERARLVRLLEGAGLLDAAVTELRTGSTRARRYAAETLALAPCADATEALRAALADPDRDVRLTSARALAGLGDGDSLPAVFERDVAAAPGAVAEALLVLASERPAAVARIAAESSSEELRTLAVSVIAELRNPEHAPLLVAALASQADEVAATAARGLGLIGDVDSLAHLARLVECGDRSPVVRASAVEALGAIGDPRVARLLEWELRSSLWPLQANAAEALALLGTEGADALERARTSRNATTRRLAHAALDR